jgi:hypothetical protein
MSFSLEAEEILEESSDACIARCPGFPFTYDAKKSSESSLNTEKPATWHYFVILCASCQAISPHFSLIFSLLCF